MIELSDNPYTLNGFRASHRNRWGFLEKGILTPSTFLLLEFYIDVCVFDDTKPSFGTFKVHYKTIQKKLNCCEQSIRDWNEVLLDLGFIKRTNLPLNFELACHKRYWIKTKLGNAKAYYYQDLEKNKTFEEMLQNFGLNTSLAGNISQLDGNKVQPSGIEQTDIADVTEKDTSIAIPSYKVNNVYSKEVRIRQSVRTTEEYLQIKTNGNYSNLTVEDCRWIDENVRNDKKIENTEKEKEIIETVIDGNTKEYEKCLTH